MPSVDGVLEILDASAEEFIFPMLDNGYIYPAAARLSAFTGEDGWAVVFDTFGFSPRAGRPDTAITSIGEGLIATESAADFASQEAFETFRKVNQHWRQDFEFPLEDGAWNGGEYAETVRAGCDSVVFRGEELPLPSLETLTAIDQQGGIGEPLHIANLARALAASQRERVLAQEEFKRVPRDWTRLLRLCEWHHPDLAAGEKPSELATFQSIAAAIANGDPEFYTPEEPNTHWSNWPEGGLL